MVTILPRPTSAADVIGQALGGGFEQGAQKGSEIGLQRGLLQNALQGLKDLSPNASALEKTSYLLKATAGLPDQGRIMQAIAPLLVGQGRNENIFGPQANPPQGGMPTQNAPAPQTSGQLPSIPTPEYVDQFAKNYAQQHQHPGAYLEGRQIAESQQRGAQEAQNNFINRAVQEVPELKLHPERLPLFMKEAQAIASSGETDINKILEKSREAFRLGANRDLDSLINGYVPGAVKGALRKAHGTLGITSALAQGGQTRDEAIKGLSGSVKRLIDKGFEAEARGILAQEHKLSPTEIEELIHPLNTKTIDAINGIPEARKIPQASHEQRLDKLLQDNFSKDESLLAIRHRLWNEKGYDWREIADAMRKIEPQMSPFQKLEMQTIENDPPVQSLSDIFRGWDRFVNFLSGAK